VSTYPHPLIAREGWPYLAIVLVVALVFTWLGWGIAAFIAWLLFFFILQFFRDPPRAVPAEPHAVLSPADGRVVRVERVRDPTSDATRSS
jgi:phosphatidylserine decarboxylase